MHFCHKNDCEDPKLTIGNHNIEVVDKMQFLGVIFDRKLTFQAHINELKEKCGNSINLLEVVSHQHWGADRNSKLRLYQALVRSRLDYRSVVYNSACSTHLQIVRVIQTTCLRICLGAFCTSPNVSLQVEANDPPPPIRDLKLKLNYALNVKSNAENPANQALFSDYSSIVRDSVKPPPV